MAFLTKTTYNGGANTPDGTGFTETDLHIDGDEARDSFIRDMVEEQEYLTTTTIIDDYTNEDILLEARDYFTDKEIDTLNDMFRFIEVLHWTEEQVKFILEEVLEQRRTK